MNIKQKEVIEQLKQIKETGSINVRPITPDEAVTETWIPNEVLEVVNAMLREKYSKNGGVVTITQKDLVERILNKYESLNLHMTKKIITDNHYLDFEDKYREAGWNVTYDRPAYNETYEASFIFSKGK